MALHLLLRFEVQRVICSSESFRIFYSQRTPPSRWFCGYWLGGLFVEIVKDTQVCGEVVVKLAISGEEV